MIKSKRLLVDNSQVEDQRLRDLESKVQSLMAESNTQKSKITEQDRIINSLNAQLLNLPVVQNIANIVFLSSTETQRFYVHTLHLILGRGAIFTRWGKHACPDNTSELVYSGAADYLCLPPDPNFGPSHPDDSDVQYIYGAEYDNYFYKNLFDDDVPCAVCRSTVRTTALMIPGRNDCYKGWKKEYYGTLASDRFRHSAATQFVCLDENPEPILGSSQNFNGKLFVPVKGVCGSLPCPPYDGTHYFTCVVCTK
ncbi:hypothetical protein KUTeg_023956 [Tegillarca granosa]|uniref:Short-chain collagen C4 n=1 Tax=Tegillarca granosa TaxID=220873 RepID=A0ABQ9DX14_TEGGR|nr:hypothetical protein KUTeg_023956 [Tegillarca granosa]